MKTLQTARLAYLTNPGPGRYYLNFQFYEGSAVTQVAISMEQLGNIVADGAEIALSTSLVESNVSRETIESNEAQG